MKQTVMKVETKFRDDFVLVAKCHQRSSGQGCSWLIGEEIRL